MLNLFKDEENEAVINWQIHLNHQGIDVKVTGKFDEQTEIATKIFQSTNYLKVDGVAGPKSLAFVNAINTENQIKSAVAETENEEKQT